MFTGFIEQFTPVDWSEVKEREIVKNSIPIILLERNSENCLVTAEKFDYIINFSAFVRAEEMAKKLQYDRNGKTIILPCNELQGDKSRLNVWFVIKEAPKHATKYQYFITPWNETSSSQN